MNVMKTTGAIIKTGLMAGALASAFALSGCGAEAEAPAQEAVEGQIPGMSVENARMVLGAVEGNPAAVYFDLKYEGDRGLSISRAKVAQAKNALLHDYGEYDFKVQMMEALPIPLQNGTEVAFEPGGLHVMAIEPSAELQPGGKAEVTLTVSGGDTHTFEADIYAAGDESAHGASGEES